MHVNLSPPSCATPSSWRVAAGIDDASLDPSRLVLEVTESALLEDPRLTSAQLERLRALGVRIAIDDFGTGYSSLQTLQKLPIDMLKMAKVFVEEDEGLALQTTILQLASALGVQVVAEGIEARPSSSACATRLRHGPGLPPLAAAQRRHATRPAAAPGRLPARGRVRPARPRELIARESDWSASHSRSAASKRSAAARVSQRQRMTSASRSRRSASQSPLPRCHSVAVAAPVLGGARVAEQLAGRLAPRAGREPPPAAERVAGIEPHGLRLLDPQVLLGVHDLLGRGGRAEAVGRSSRRPSHRPRGAAARTAGPGCREEINCASMNGRASPVSCPSEESSPPSVCSAEWRSA